MCSEIIANSGVILSIEHKPYLACPSCTIYKTMSVIVTYNVDCKREVGDSLSSPMYMYMYMHRHMIIIARKHSTRTVTCTCIPVHRKHKLIHLVSSFVMSTQNDWNLYWPTFSCPKKQARQNIDYRLKTAQYLLREYFARATNYRPYSYRCKRGITLLPELWPGV